MKSETATVRTQTITLTDTEADYLKVLLTQCLPPNTDQPIKDFQEELFNALKWSHEK